jgi:hypothetical protein
MMETWQGRVCPRGLKPAVNAGPSAADRTATLPFPLQTRRVHTPKTAHCIAKGAR